MIISRIKLRNWRNFYDIEVSIRKRVFIVGANASGKSNLLDAIRFLKDVCNSGLQKACEYRGGAHKIRSLSARQYNKVLIEIDISEYEESKKIWTYALEFGIEGGGVTKRYAKVISETVVKYQDSKEYKILSRKTEESEDNLIPQFTDIEQPKSNQDFREIYTFLKEIDYIHIVPHLIRESSYQQILPEKEDFYGKYLLKRINILNDKIRNSYLREINDILKIAVPQLTELKFKKDEQGAPHLEAKYAHWRSKGVPQDETQFSDGTLRLIGFFWALLDGKESILMEEPELYLHAAIVEQIPKAIAKIQLRKKRQVIITTHSYDLLSAEGISPEEIIILKPDKNGTTAILASEDEDAITYFKAGFRASEAVLPIVKPENIGELSNNIR